MYDFFPGAETVLLKHFSGPGGMNGYTNTFNMEGGSSSRSYNSSNKGMELLNTVKLIKNCKYMHWIMDLMKYFDLETRSYC